MRAARRGILVSMAYDMTLEVRRGEAVGRACRCRQRHCSPLGSLIRVPEADGGIPLAVEAAIQRVRSVIVVAWQVDVESTARWMSVVRLGLSWFESAKAQRELNLPRAPLFWKEYNAALLWL